MKNTKPNTIIDLVTKKPSSLHQVVVFFDILTNVTQLFVHTIFQQCSEVENEENTQRLEIVKLTYKLL